MRRGKLFLGERGRQCKCNVCQHYFVIGENQVFIPPTCGKRYCVNQWLGILCKRRKSIVPKNFGTADCAKSDTRELEVVLTSYVKQSAPDTVIIADLIDILMLVANKAGVDINILKAVPPEARSILEKVLHRAA